MTGLHDQSVNVYGIEFAIEPSQHDDATDDSGLVAVVRLGSNPSPDRTYFHMSPTEAQVHLPGGSVRIRNQRPYLVDLDIVQEVTLDGLVHPYLAFPAAVIHHWEGRHVLHAGAFDVAGRSIVVMAESDGGKSTTIAAALAAGYPARSDDVVIVDGRTVLGGAPLIDLRTASGQILGGQNIGKVGARERWRINTAEMTQPCPIGMFVRLEWGDAVAVERLGVADLLGALHEFSALGAPALVEADPMHILDLLDLPFVRATRPRDHERLPEIIALLTETLRTS